MSGVDVEFKGPLPGSKSRLGDVFGELQEKSVKNLFVKWLKSLLYGQFRPSGFRQSTQSENLHGENLSRGQLEYKNRDFRCFFAHDNPRTTSTFQLFSSFSETARVSFEELPMESESDFNTNQVKGYEKGPELWSARTPCWSCFGCVFGMCSKVEILVNKFYVSNFSQTLFLGPPVPENIPQVEKTRWSWSRKGVIKVPIFRHIKQKHRLP